MCERIDAMRQVREAACELTQACKAFVGPPMPRPDDEATIASLLEKLMSVPAPRWATDEKEV